jgi:hypothetical protein
MIQASDKDLLRQIAGAAIGLGVMLAAVRYLGEVHGLAATVVGLLVVNSHLSVRLDALRREVRSLHHPPSTKDAPTTAT